MKNPFLNLPIPTPEEIEIRAQKAYMREREKKVKRVMNKEKQFKQIISRALNSYYRSVKASLNQPHKFPNFDELPKFYRELYLLSEDEVKIKQSLGKISAAKKVMKKIFYEVKGDVIKAKSDKVEKEGKKAKGRLNSVIDSLEKELKYLRKTARKLSQIPMLHEELPIGVIAGFPNVGKSTLLGRITGSTPKTASYAFTTTDLNLGIFKDGIYKMQIIDTPGITEKPPVELSKVEQKALLALKENCKLGIFVVDPTETSGYNLDYQKTLFLSLKKEIKTSWIVILSKIDIATKEDIEKYTKEFGAIKLEEVLERIKEIARYQF